MTFSWDFHNIAVHSVMGLSSALLICNVNLIAINAPINSNRGILMAFSGAYLEFAELTVFFQFHLNTPVAHTLQHRRLSQNHHLRCVW